MSAPARLALVDASEPALSIVAQCRLLRVARSTLYYRPASVSADDLAVMRRMDELYLATPFYGSRRMTAVLRRDGLAVNRKRVRRLMRVMGLEAIYQKPNTSGGHRLAIAISEIPPREPRIPGAARPSMVRWELSKRRLRVAGVSGRLSSRPAGGRSSRCGRIR